MNIKREKPKVGDVLYLLTGNRYSGICGLRPVTVRKIGTKYFEIMEIQRTRFHLHNWRQDTDYLSRYTLFSSEQEYLDKEESDNLVEWLMGYRDFGKLSLEKLRKLKLTIEAAS